METNRHNKDFKGVFIPKEIWLAEDLTVYEKIMLNEARCVPNIRDLDTRREIGDFLQISMVRVNKLLRSLNNKGYLDQLNQESSK